MNSLVFNEGNKVIPFFRKQKKKIEINYSNLF